ncbi:DUF2691 family protein [Filobacillus milosensis]|uniref:DUF2691 family protein n=1 Tax=Filobacillus milosensis TaxID=94137 RepID=A0A4Y8IR12_9BACI|nr:DUF2691 family protein [Filobacillus milosensis]TFB22904.1 DUF2691 family protein [Filobacillus milosensis]
MKALSFQIPNEYGNYLGEILKPINMSKYNWWFDDVESYLKKTENKFALPEDIVPLFTEEINHMNSSNLQSYFEDNTYYLIFADIKAFPEGSEIKMIKTFGEFMESDCELSMLIIDQQYVEIFCKQEEMLQQLYQNAVEHNFENVRYINVENDTMLSV